MILSHDIISHYLAIFYQVHIYLLFYFYQFPNSSIIKYYINKKCIHLYYQLLFYYNFDFYSPILCLLGLVFFTFIIFGIRIIPQSFTIDRRPIKQNQPRMVLVLEDVTLFHKYYALKTFLIRPKYITHQKQQNIAPLYLFDSIIREVDSIIGGYQ